MASPAAPALKVEGSKVMVSFDVPTGACAAVVYFTSKRQGEKQGKQFYDAETKSVLPVGKTGKVIPLTPAKGAGRKKVKAKSVEVCNLSGDVSYTATVSFRGADDFEFGPTSPASAPLTLVLPVTPQAPRIEAWTEDSIRVTFVMPPDCVEVYVLFHDGRQELSVKPDLTLGPKLGGFACGKPGPSIIVTGLSATLTYKVALASSNGRCWGTRGPWSKPLKISAHVPEPPSAPLVDNITQSSVRLRLKLMSDCTAGGIELTHGNVCDYFDYTTLKLVTPKVARPPPASKLAEGIVISGLQPDTSYQVACCSRSKIGWGEYGPLSNFRTLSDVEITGTRTQEERDAELRKRAVDVDVADPPPPPKRAKK